MRRIAQIDIDPLKETIALWGFPVDLPIQADTSKALPGLLAAVTRRGDAGRPPALGGAPRAIRGGRTPRTAAHGATALSRPARPATDRRRVGRRRAGRTAAADDSIVLDEMVTSSDAVRRFLGAQTTGQRAERGRAGPGLGTRRGASARGSRRPIRRS